MIQISLITKIKLNFCCLNKRIHNSYYLYSIIAFDDEYLIFKKQMTPTHRCRSHLFHLMFFLFCSLNAASCHKYQTPKERHGRHVSVSVVICPRLGISSNPFNSFSSFLKIKSAEGTTSVLHKASNKKIF